MLLANDGLRWVCLAFHPTPCPLRCAPLFHPQGFVVPVCCTCGKADTGHLLRCGKCRTASYCSEKCQRQSWSRHKKVGLWLPAAAALFANVWANAGTICWKLKWCMQQWAATMAWRLDTSCLNAY